MNKFLKRFTFAAISASLVLSLASCAGNRESLSPSRVAISQVVGSIFYENPQHGFVLLNTSGGITPAAGTQLRTFRGKKPTGTIEVSPERQGAFLVADVIQGNPEKGDIAKTPPKTKLEFPGS